MAIRNLLGSPPQIPSVGMGQSVGVGMGQAGVAPAVAMSQMMSNAAQSVGAMQQHSYPAADKWRATIEKTEDGYILEMAKFGGAEKKFIAKDIDELKDKLVSSMVLSKMKDK